MATSLNNAIDTDHRFLGMSSITERAAEDDRRAAIALSNGEPLPPQSNAQRLVEDTSFTTLSEPLWKKSIFNSRKVTQKPDVDAVTRSSIVILDKQSSSKGKARAMESKNIPPVPK
ncbi:hypothetical protein C0993_003619 [Termitomyces sp. T159_Od127]|nr:hypothetical protein C0993_003619 [Termitomyces sp. T159_Od127]